MNNVILSNFIKLSISEKRRELVVIFSAIKNKNNNCKIIYDKLIDKEYEFTDNLLIEIFEEAIGLYDAIKQNSWIKKTIIWNTTASILRKIYEAEKNQWVIDDKEAENLLNQI